MSNFGPRDWDSVIHVAKGHLGRVEETSRQVRDNFLKNMLFLDAVTTQFPNILKLKVLKMNSDNKRVKLSSQYGKKSSIEIAF